MKIYLIIGILISLFLIGCKYPKENSIYCTECLKECHLVKPVATEGCYPFGCLKEIEKEPNGTEGCICQYKDSNTTVFLLKTHFGNETR